MAKLKEIVEFLDTELSWDGFSDLSLNGLQFEGSKSVHQVAVAVDAGFAVIEDAVRGGAQLLIVHHGLFWGKPFAITGAAKKTFRALLNNDLSLYASHLPLDAHETLGNNFSLARLLELGDLAPFARHGEKLIGCKGKNVKQKTLEDLKQTLSELPGALPSMPVLNFGPDIPEVVGIVSGSAADVLHQHEEEGFDTFITGEPRQFAYHFARENGLNAIFAGHYGTETIGVRELGKVIEEKFSVSVNFIDCPTGI